MQSRFDSYTEHSLIKKTYSVGLRLFCSHLSLNKTELRLALETLVSVTPSGCLSKTRGQADLMT